MEPARDFRPEDTGCEWVLRLYNSIYYSGMQHIFSLSFRIFEQTDKIAGGLRKRNRSVVCRDKSALRHRLPDIQHGQSVTAVRGAEIRNERDAEADPGEIDQQIVAAQLDCGNKIEGMLQKQIVQKGARCRTAAEHQDGELLELREGQRLRQRKMLRAGKEHIAKGFELPDQPFLNQEKN